MSSIYGSQESPEAPSKSFTLPLNSEHQVTFTFKDPYGFLEASVIGFALPSEFEGKFTSFKEAQTAVNTYLTKNPNGPIIPTMKTKKAA